MAKKTNRGGKRAGWQNGLTSAQIKYVNGYVSVLGVTPQQVINSSAYNKKFGTNHNQQNPQQAQQQTQQAQPVQQATPVTTMSASYNSFTTMNDDGKADVISSMTSQAVPAHLANNDFQKFIYNIGLNDKPDLVDDATFSKLSGKTIYRTVNSVYDSSNDISYNANQIAKQVQSGRITRVSDNGGSVYGRGIYFADNLRDSTAYGRTHGNVQKTAVMKAKLNSNANVVNYYSAYQGAMNEIRSGSKLGKALKKCDHDSQVSLYALAKGYNVISNGNTYLNVLSRQALTMSSSVDPM